jgi:hypothetical protein
MILHILLLLFRPARFVDVAAQQAIEKEFSSNKQFRAKYPDRALPSEVIENFTKSARKQTTQIRSALFGGVLLTLAVMLFGWLVGIGLACWLGMPSKLIVYGFQAAGAAIILGATLGEVGRRIDTWDGDTLPERINAATFRVAYMVGTLLFVVSFSWDASF